MGLVDRTVSMQVARCEELSQFRMWCRYVEKRLMQEERAALQQDQDRLQARVRELETLAATAER